MSKTTFVQAGSAPIIDVFGQRETILWDDATNTIFFNDLPPGVGVPMHIHAAMDESCLVVSGHIKFVSGDQVIEARTGDYIHIGRGVVHGFVALSETRLLWVCAPGGYQQFFVDLAQVPMGSEGPDFGAMNAVAARYGIELVGPPPQP